MKKKIEHTPLPWQTEGRNWPVKSDPHFWAAKITNESKTLGVANTYATTPEEAVANAAFIVRAVNVHDELVEALRYVDGSLDHRVYGDLKARIRAALAKAEGK